MHLELSTKLNVTTLRSKRNVWLLFLLLNGSSTTFSGKSQSQSSQPTSLWSQFSRSPFSPVQNVSSEWDWDCRNSHSTCTTNQAQRISAIPYHVQPYHSPKRKLLLQTTRFSKYIQATLLERGGRNWHGGVTLCDWWTTRENQTCNSECSLSPSFHEYWHRRMARKQSQWKYWYCTCIREYWPYRDELSTQNGLAYRGTRIIISFINETRNDQQSTCIAPRHAVYHWHDKRDHVLAQNDNIS